MNDTETRTTFNNAEEGEIAQINNLLQNQNAIGLVQAALAKQRSQPSLESCETCGEDIPEARRIAVPGCTQCITCKEIAERRV